MHELSLSQGIVARTVARLRELGLSMSAVRTIRIRVGDLSGVDAEALLDCLREMLPASGLPDASAELVREKARVICPSCGELEASSPFRLACPRCGAVPERVEGGRDITVESVEVEDDAPQDASA